MYVKMSQAVFDHVQTTYMEGCATRNSNGVIATLVERDSNIKSTPSIHPGRLADLGTLHQQNLARLNVGSTLLSFALPLLMLRSTLIMLHSRLIMLAHAWQWIKIMMPQVGYASLRLSAGPDFGPPDCNFTRVYTIIPFEGS
jgi:hypothetical protein